MSPEVEGANQPVWETVVLLSLFFWLNSTSRLLYCQVQRATNGRKINYTWFTLRSTSSRTALNSARVICCAVRRILGIGRLLTNWKAASCITVRITSGRTTSRACRGRRRGRRKGGLIIDQLREHIRGIVRGPGRTATSLA